MRHLFDKPIDLNRAELGNILFMIIVIGPIVVFGAHLGLNPFANAIIFICSLFIISTVSVRFPFDYATYIYKSETFDLIKAKGFYSTYRYVIKIDVLLQSQSNYPLWQREYFFMTKKSAIRYCLEIEKKRIKEGINNIPSVMRLQAML